MSIICILDHMNIAIQNSTYFLANSNLKQPVSRLHGVCVLDFRAGLIRIACSRLPKAQRGFLTACLPLMPLTGAQSPWWVFAHRQELLCLPWLSSEVTVYHACCLCQFQDGGTPAQGSRKGD